MCSHQFNLIQLKFAVAVLSFGHRRETVIFVNQNTLFCCLTDQFLVYAALLLASIMFVCHSASFKLLLAQACHLNTYKLFLFVRREACHLLFVGLHLLFIILEVSHYKPKTTKAEIRLLMHKEAMSGLYFQLDFFFFFTQHVIAQWNISYLFSLALCLKSSTAFMNRVTL